MTEAFRLFFLLGKGILMKFLKDVRLKIRFSKHDFLRYHVYCAVHMC